MEWQPEEQPLRQLALYLKDSLSGHDQNAQKNAELMLKQAKQSPDINNYLAYFFQSSNNLSAVNLPAESLTAVRIAAAIMLKNDVKSSYKSMPENSKTYIRTVIVHGLQDPSAQIRNHAGNVITEVVKQGGVMGWPQIIPELVALISNESGNVTTQTQEGAMSALLKVCEDNKKALDKEYHGQRPLDIIIPRLLDFATSPSAKVRANALACVNIFIPEAPEAVMSNLDNLIMTLSQLAGDPSDDVRKYICRCFVHVADISPERIAPNMGDLVEYMVAQQRSVDDPELALDAAEFWLAVGENENLREGLGPYLPKVVPVLLECMVYSEDDILRLEGENEDADQEDRDQDIKPTFASNKASRMGTSANGQNSASKENGAVGAAEVEDGELSDGELDEFDYGDDIGDPEEQWNLRKCSAAALDVMASVFHGPVFEVTLPYLKENLDHREWPNREAAVLALGAIADGCVDVVEPHLPELTKYLISLLDDKEPIVRQITCWSLGRYSGWAAKLDENGRQLYFEPMMAGILKRMLDGNKRVQEAAASAFANLEEKASRQLTGYATIIVRQFVNCFDRYKDRNMFILYDCVQTLAEHVGPGLAQPELVDLLMPALIQRWNKVSDQSREMFPLLECLSYVATALTDSFAPFAKPIFTRCIHIIHKNLEDTYLAQGNPLAEVPEKDFLVTSLDLLSAIIQALDEKKSAELVATSTPNLFKLLDLCMKDPNNDVRQSAYALLGDCAIYVFEQLQPHLPQLIVVLIAQLKHLSKDAITGYSVINNACWSIGEIAMRYKEGMAPYIDNLLQNLVSILFAANLPKSLNENAAIAIGRLGIGCSDRISPHLNHFAPFFVKVIRNVDWTDEKGHALKGFVKIMLGNPAAMEICLLEFFAEMASAPSEFLAGPKGDSPFEAFQSVITRYQTMIPNFNAFLSHLPPEQLQALRQTFQI